MSTDGKRRPLPPGWRWAKLGDVCAINPRRSPGFNRAPDAPTSFVPMSAVDDERGTIAIREIRPYREVARGYTFFEEGDVLFAKITPCMENGKSAIAKGLTDGVGLGSTEFHILRPGPLVCADWIHAFVRWPAFRSEAARHFTGSVGQQRVPEDFVAESLIAVPPLAEQRRIAARLAAQTAEVERMRRLAREQVEAARALPAAFLRQVFESEEAQRWPRVRLGEVCSLTAYQVDPTLSRYRDLPHVSGDNIESGTCRLLPVRTAEEDRMTSGKYCFRPGDVLYSKIRPYLRKAVHVDFDGLCSADIYPLTPRLDVADPRWLTWLLVSDSFTEYADAESKRVRMPKLNRDQLFSWHAPLPPLASQRRQMDELHHRMANAEELRSIGEAQLEAVNALPGAFLEDVFGGFEPPA